MSDDLKNRGEPDRSRISLTEEHENLIARIKSSRAFLHSLGQSPHSHRELKPCFVRYCSHSVPDFGSATNAAMCHEATSENGVSVSDEKGGQPRQPSALSPARLFLACLGQTLTQIVSIHHRYEFDCGI